MADCVFDQIAAGKIPADIVFQDETVMAFNDLHPKAPVHVLIIPKKHITNIPEMSTEDAPIVAHMMEIANVVAKEKGISAFKLVINNGADAGQVVMHLHMHLLGGRKISSVV
jgi:diadenosine tetraphosphate (Ap4A) HIT family hydrolase